MSGASKRNSGSAIHSRPPSTTVLYVRPVAGSVIVPSDLGAVTFRVMNAAALRANWSISALRLSTARLALDTMRLRSRFDMGGHTL